MQATKIEIPLSKFKMVVLLLGSLLFVALGILMLLNAEDMQTKTFGPGWIMGFGLLGILFFGTITVSVARKLFSKKAGLIIDSKGIYDNSSGISAGFIPWEDISGIRTIQVMTTKFLLIDVKEPHMYLTKVRGLKLQAMKANYKKYDTPVSISSAALKYNFKKLEQLLMEYYSKNKRNL